MKQLKISGVIICVFALTITLVTCSGSDTPSSNSTGVDSVITTACLAPAYWFPHQQTPMPDEGPNGPFGKAPEPDNCVFHQWAFQKFLYLTRGASGPISNLPHFLSYHQIDNNMEALGSTIILDDTTQAGSHSTLFDKNKKPVYYSIFMSDTMFKFASKMARYFSARNIMVAADSLNQAEINKAGYDTVTFPVGSTIVKTAWILASSLDRNQLNKFYVTKGKFKKSGKMTDIALLGMHIIGRVQNHPEFIWATFEHDNLAPYATWPENFATDSTPDPKQVLSTNSFVFYDANQKLIDCSVRPYSATQRNPPQPEFRSTYHIYRQGTQPQFAGMGTVLRQQDSLNQVNIISINRSVKIRLGEKSIWSNYNYVGAVWTDPTLQPLKPGDSNMGGLTRNGLRGSRANTNISMETFAQLNWSYPNTSPPPVEPGNITPGNSMNCFGCHGTQTFVLDTVSGASYNMALSHVFNNHLKLLSNKMYKKKMGNQ